MTEDQGTAASGLEDLFPALDLPDETGLPALAWIADEFRREHGLPLPPVPRELAGKVRALARGLVTSREDGLGPYELQPFLDELAADPDDYLLFGTAGHGVDAWAMHYYLVQPHLALFIQIRFGGAYGDHDRERSRVAAAFVLAESLILAPQLDTLRAAQRLVVVACDLAGSCWGTLGPRGTGLERTDDALGAALEWLEGEHRDIRGLAEQRAGPIWG